MAGKPTHDMTGTPEYMAWRNMRNRCSNKNSPDYPYCGGRGIKVCERWDGSFENFLEDMGNKPSNMTLDRVDNDKGHSKDNCRWADRKQQTNNRRTSLMIEHNGKSMCLSDWAVEANISYRNLYSRIYKLGWSMERALGAKIKPKERKPITEEEYEHKRQKKPLKTHCSSGHPYSGDNLSFRKTKKGNISRVCKTCEKKSRDKHRKKFKGLTQKVLDQRATKTLSEIKE